MNMQSLRRDYRKLTPRERFAAIQAAAARGDKLEQDALLNSAPRRQFSCGHTFGLAQGFFLAILSYGFSQSRYLSEARLLALLRETRVGKAKKAEYDSALESVIIALISNCVAWHQICAEYGLDPDAMLRHVPFRDVVELAEKILMGMPQEKLLDWPEVRERIEAKRDLIETQRKYWG